MRYPLGRFVARPDVLARLVSHVDGIIGLQSMYLIGDPVLSTCIGLSNVVAMSILAAYPYLMVELVFSLAIPTRAILADASKQWAKVAPLTPHQVLVYLSLVLSHTIGGVFLPQVGGAARAYRDVVLSNTHGCDTSPFWIDVY